jgi:rhodanese-related sulfurtransferase
MNKITIRQFALLGLMLGVSVCTTAGEKIAVKIIPTLAKIEVIHKGKKVVIMRNQNQKATVNPDFAKTSRKCPPFCINPIKLAPGVETIGELEILQYLQKVARGDKSVMVIDSRTPAWVAKGTIPGSVNIPWTTIAPQKGASPIDIADTLTGKFGVKEVEGLFDFRDAKTLVLFCNGMWCGQSPNNIRTLLRFGYPAHKIKWYRGGMQNWSNLGFTTVK